MMNAECLPRMTWVASKMLDGFRGLEGFLIFRVEVRISIFQQETTVGLIRHKAPCPLTKLVLVTRHFWRTQWAAIARALLPCVVIQWPLYGAMGHDSIIG